MRRMGRFRSHNTLAGQLSHVKGHVRPLAAKFQSSLCYCLKRAVQRSIGRQRRIARSPAVHCSSFLTRWVGLDRRDIVAFDNSTATTSAIANLSRQTALLRRFRYVKFRDIWRVFGY